MSDFDDGGGLAGESGLGDLEVAALNEADIGGDPIPGRQLDDIADDQFSRWNALGDAGPDDGGFGDEALGEGFDGPFGLGFLEVADPGVDQDDHQNDDGIENSAEDEFDDGRDDEQVDQWAVELEKEAEPGAATLPRGQDVGAEGLLPTFDFEKVEATSGVGVQQLSGLVLRDVVLVVAEDVLHGFEASRRRGGKPFTRTAGHRWQGNHASTNTTFGMDS